jgi:hypothetical protein
MVSPSFQIFEVMSPSRVSEAVAPASTYGMCRLDVEEVRALDGDDGAGGVLHLDGALHGGGVVALEVLAVVLDGVRAGGGEVHVVERGAGVLVVPGALQRATRP